MVLIATGGSAETWSARSSECITLDEPILTDAEQFADKAQHLRPGGLSPGLSAFIRCEIMVGARGGSWAYRRAMCPRVTASRCGIDCGSGYFPCPQDWQNSGKNRFGGGGQGWIRTSVRSRGQIYSLLPLTTRPPLLRQARNYSTELAARNRSRQQDGQRLCRPYESPPNRRRLGWSCTDHAPHTSAAAHRAEWASSRIDNLCGRGSQNAQLVQSKLTKRPIQHQIKASSAPAQPCLITPTHASQPSRRH